jgi:hypothetical protein
VLTSRDYAEMLEEAELSPFQREAFEYERRRAVAREERNAALSEESKRTRAVTQWQAETFRVLSKVFVLQFEAKAWDARRPRPLGSEEALGKLTAARGGLRQRLHRARREAAAGCRYQREWLGKHAELIAAVEAS